MTEYYSGTVDSFNDFAGYGYLEPDDRDQLGTLILFHRHSVRNPATKFRRGDRLLFKLETVPRGSLAVDVHLESTPDVSEFPLDSLEGIVAATKRDRNFGFIRLADGRSIFFHASHLQDGSNLPPPGTRVSFSLVNTSRGLQARDVHVITSNHGQNSAPPTALNNVGQPAEQTTAEMCLARATLARDARDYTAATRHYEQGMELGPSVHLILSYAAMQKNRRNFDDAMHIYERGIAIYQDVAKLREDAGTLAAAMNKFDVAASYLLKALQICRTTNQGGEKGVLLALGRTMYRWNTFPALKKSLEYYELAMELFESGRMPANDLLNVSIARIRTQHHRGDIAIRYFSQAGFELERANLLDEKTVGGDMIVRLRNAEFQESYCISERLLVRCMFKSDVSQRDIDDLADEVQQLGSTALVDEHLALLVVASLSDGLQRSLFRRIDSHQSAIVPLPQDQLERSEDALGTLRTILDQWMYRRDLFAVNAPVVGKGFFGRNRALSELREAIQTGASTGVFGLRKVGKTSLLKETERRFSEAGDIVVYLDLLRVPADVNDARWLYWRIGQELFRRAPRRGMPDIKWRLGGVYEDFLDVPDDFPVATAFDADLSRLLKALRQSKLNPVPRIIIMLDEIEKILPSSLGREGFRGYFDFFGFLRGVCQERDDFVVVVTGANPAVAEAPQFEGRDNPVFNFFREVYLHLLNQNECVEMIRTLGRGMGIRFTEDAARLVFGLTGGHPFFARQLCSFVAKRHLDRPLQINSHVINSLLGSYIELAGKDFGEILERLRRDYPDELQVLLTLAKVDSPVPLVDLGAHGVSLRHLEGYQLVVVHDASASLTMQLMRRWLKWKGLA